jgi:hypothetical protein
VTLQKGWINRQLARVERDAHDGPEWLRRKAQKGEERMTDIEIVQAAIERIKVKGSRDALQGLSARWRVIAALIDERNLLCALVDHLGSWQDCAGNFHDLTNPEAQVQPLLDELAATKALSVELNAAHRKFERLAAIAERLAAIAERYRNERMELLQEINELEAKRKPPRKNSSVKAVRR